MIRINDSGWRSGLKDWVLHRVSGLFIVIYFVFLLIYLHVNGLNYDSWYFLFSCFYFKIATVLFSFNLAIHSSIGIGIVLTDYIKNTLLRLLLELSVNFLLLSYIFCIMQILWGSK
ncbi:MAG TPA: succinate dehydrogenase, hydrophobic membrane anchor protein [Candidatus Azoamicus sp. OHIO1]